MVHRDCHLARRRLRMAEQFIERLHRSAWNAFLGEKALPLGPRPPLDFLVQPPVQLFAMGDSAGIGLKARIGSKRVIGQQRAKRLKLSVIADGDDDRTVACHVR